jgi:hypothetical protein
MTLLRKFPALFDLFYYIPDDCLVERLILDNEHNFSVVARFNAFSEYKLAKDLLHSIWEDGINDLRKELPNLEFKLWNFNSASLDVTVEEKE